MSNFFNVTPGIFITEIDATYLPGAVAEIGSALIGLSEFGRAFYPTLVTNWQDWLVKFGKSNSDYYAPYGAKKYLRYRRNLLFTRILGTGEVNTLGDITSNDVGLPIVAKIDVTTPSLSAGATTATEHVGNVSSASAWAVIGILRPNLYNSASSFNIATTYDVSAASAVSLTVSVSSNGASAQSITIPDIDNIKSYFSTDPHVNGWNGTLTGFYLDELMTPYCSLTPANYQGGHGFASWHNSTTGSETIELTSAYTSPNLVAENNLIAYNFATTPWVVSQPQNNSISRLFRFHTLADGNNANKKIKIQISNLRTDVDYDTNNQFTKFDVLVRNLYDSDLYPEVLERFLDCNLIPAHQNYIARKIGDVKEYWDFENQTMQKLGDWDNKSNYVRVEMISHPVESNLSPVALGNPFTLQPRGFDGIKYPNITGDSISANMLSLAYESFRYNQDLGLASKYHKRGCFGFDTTNTTMSDEICNAMGSQQMPGIVAVTNAEYSVQSITASSDYTFIPILEASVESLTSNYVGVIDVQFVIPFQGGYDGWGKVNSYKDRVNTNFYTSFLKGLTILNNTELFDFNLLFVPGTDVTVEQHTDIINAAVAVCEDRKDAFYIADMVPFNDTPNLDRSGETILLGYDTNYGCYYAPGWVKIYDDENDEYVKCPNSIAEIGLFAYNDTIANVWDSPAGTIRGLLNDIVYDVQYKLNQDHKNNVYRYKGNPIAYYTNIGFMNDTARTLQSKESALTDISTRRVLIYLEKAVSSVARKILNEPNNDNSRQRFYNEIQPAFRIALEKGGIRDYRLHVAKFDPNRPKTLAGTFYVYPMDRIVEIKIDFILSRDESLFNEQ